MTKIATITLTAALLAATPTLADNTVRTPKQDKVLYELQESCSKDAATLFTEITNPNPHLKSTSGDVVAEWVSWGQVTDPKYIYENRYSQQLNKCFLLIRFNGTETVSTANAVRAEELWDVTSHRLLAQFSVPAPPDWKPPTAIICRFADRNCDVGNWNALIKPYMQDGE